MPKISWLARLKIPPMSERRHAALWVLVVLGIFLIVTAMSEPLPSYAKQAAADAPTETAFITRTPTQTLAPSMTPTPGPTATATPLPVEILENFDDTDGIVVGTILLVVIILLGTLAGIRTRRKHK